MNRGYYGGYRYGGYRVDIDMLDTGERGKLNQQLMLLLSITADTRDIAVDTEDTEA